MKAVYCLFGLFAIIALSEASSTPAGVKCMSDDDCSGTECCYKKHDLLIVSKRDAVFEGHHLQDLSHVQGECQSYHRTGDSCSLFGARNGYCSCNTKAGDSCLYMASEAHSSPMGVYRCHTMA